MPCVPVLCPLTAGMLMVGEALQPAQVAGALQPAELAPLAGAERMAPLETS